MHIAWLGKKTPFCGNVTYSREITGALTNRGHKVSFMHFADTKADGDEVPLPFLYKSQVFTIPTIRAKRVLERSLRRRKPDIVHASLSLSPLDFLLPEICQELNLPLISTFHTPYDGKRRNVTSTSQLLAYQLYAPFLARYDRTIIFCEEQQDLLVKLGVPRDRIIVIPNGVDDRKYTPGPSNIRTEFNAQQIYVYQGRISTEKNVESLLKAWKYCNMSDYGCKLLLVGDGPLRPNLEPFYNTEHGVIWLGAIRDDARRIEILRGADVFILPSLVEGLSLSLLEAMSCGIACVATDAGADASVIADGAGVVINTQGVSTQLRTLLPVLREHQAWREILGKSARQRVLDCYTLTGNIDRIERLYGEILAPIQQVG
jgi:glycosyltransferase involved in cell wall biosynthesis